MEILPLKTGVLKVGFDLIKTIEQTLVKHHVRLKNNDILIISSKIIAVSEGRVVKLKDITPSKRAKNLKATRYGTDQEDPRIKELVLQEADAVIPGRMLLTLKDGCLVPAAGIDLSNAPDGCVILWPENSFGSARKIWQTLKKKFHLRKFGVVICDSHCQPLRFGTTGLAIAWAGFQGTEDCRGKKDIYGKRLAFTRKASADNLASSALLVMGEAAEKVPFVLARNTPVKFTNKPQKTSDIFAQPDDCIFSGVYSREFIRMINAL